MSIEFYNYLIKLKEHERRRKLSNSLAISINEFKERWEQFSDKFKFPHRELLINTESNFFQMILLGNKHIAFLGDTIKCFNENIIKNITMIATGDGSLESGTKILIAIGILIGCLNPNDTVEFRKSVLHDLGVFDIKEKMNNTIVKNNYKYKLVFTKETGIWISVSSTG